MPTKILYDSGLLKAFGAEANGPWAQVAYFRLGGHMPWCPFVPGYSYGLICHVEARLGGEGAYLQYKSNFDV